MIQVLLDYAITFGWALVGSFSMGIAILVTLKIVTMFTVKIDEEDLLKNNNIAVAIVIAAIIFACAYVVGAVIRP